jgi:hypothetical protein
LPNSNLLGAGLIMVLVFGQLRRALQEAKRANGMVDLSQIIHCSYWKPHWINDEPYPQPHFRKLPSRPPYDNYRHVRLKAAAMAT